MLQHPARQVAADPLEHVIRHAHLGKLGDDRVPKVVEAQSVQACLITQRPPGGRPVRWRVENSRWTWRLSNK
jgi:hypothetical protein